MSTGGQLSRSKNYRGEPILAQYRYSSNAHDFGSFLLSNALIPVIDNYNAVFDDSGVFSFRTPRYGFYEFSVSAIYFDGTLFETVSGAYYTTAFANGAPYTAIESFYIDIYKQNVLVDRQEYLQYFNGKVFALVEVGGLGTLSYSIYNFTPANTKATILCQTGDVITFKATIVNPSGVLTTPANTFNIVIRNDSGDIQNQIEISSPTCKATLDIRSLAVGT